MGSQVKYQNLSAFESHLKEAYPLHLSSAYMVLCPDAIERRQIVHHVVELIVQSGAERCVFHVGEQHHRFDELFTLVQSKPLFSAKWAVVLEEIDHLKKAEVEALGAYLEKPSPFAHLILSASKSSSLYEKAKKELVLLDMGAEKPWEKKKRIQQWLEREVAKEKKTIAEEAVHCLLDHIGLDRIALAQELFKLVVFVGEKTFISLSDVKTIAAKTQMLGLWKIAQQLIWEEASLPKQSIDDLSTFLALLAHLRNQVDLGLRICWLTAKGRPLNDVPTSLSSQALQQCSTVARRRGVIFFSKIYILLFEMEQAAKNSPPSAQLLWDILSSKILCLK